MWDHPVFQYTQHTMATYDKNDHHLSWDTLSAALLKGCCDPQPCGLSQLLVVLDGDEEHARLCIRLARHMAPNVDVRGFLVDNADAPAAAAVDVAASTASEPRWLPMITADEVTVATSGNRVAGITAGALLASVPRLMTLLGELNPAHVVVALPAVVCLEEPQLEALFCAILEHLESAGVHVMCAGTMPDVAKSMGGARSAVCHGSDSLTVVIPQAFDMTATTQVVPACACGVEGRVHKVVCLPVSVAAHASVAVVLAGLERLGTLACEERFANAEVKV